MKGSTLAQSAVAGKIREASVAGGFYPADPKELAALIDQQLSTAAPVIEGQIVAALAPHAGYLYSGPVAAWTYAALKGLHFARVVVIAPTHTVPFRFSSVYAGDGYATPLGMVEVDTDFAHRLAQMHHSLELSNVAHETRDGEHAIEVQLPWLQRVLGEFKLVPIVMGSATYESSRALGVSLAKLIAAEHDGGATLVLASSDLSHYHPHNEAQRLDAHTLSALAHWDYFSMARNFNAQVWEACGGAAIVAAMICAERLGANRADVLHRANSGDVSGDRTRVVGYGAALFSRSAKQISAPEYSLSADQKAELLSIARRSLESIANRHELYEPPAPSAEELHREAGAFVTLTRNGVLRGCVGYTSAVKPLYLTVRDTATLAAMRDQRFTPVAAAELPEIACEISVLSPLRHMSSIEQIEVGRDGLLVKNGPHEGLLLPQVAAEHHWDRQHFLEQACVKAGLARDAWADEETDVFRFTAVVFGEGDQNR